MNTLTKAGLIFLILGALSFLGLMLVALMSIGRSGNPPLTGWYATLIESILTIGLFWFVFLIIGAVLIVAGFLKQRGKWVYFLFLNNLTLENLELKELMKRIRRDRV